MQNTRTATLAAALGQEEEEGDETRQVKGEGARAAALAATQGQEPQVTEEEPPCWEGDEPQSEPEPSPQRSSSPPRWVDGSGGWVKRWPLGS